MLNNLKLDPATRHIPVQMLSVEEERQHGLSHGAFSYLVKPATTEDLEHAFDRIKTYVAPHKKRLLVVEDNDIERQGIVELLLHDDIEVAAVGTGAEALEVLQRPTGRLLRGRPAAARHERLRAARADAGRRRRCATAGRRLHRQGADRARRTRRLRRVAKSIVLKDVQSPERLFDETALFLHRVVADLPEPKRQMLERLHGSNDVLRGRKVLVVDDDARNIFALTTVLENQDMEVLRRPTAGRRSS